MKKILETLRLHEQLGLSNRQIAQAIQASPTTVIDYLRRASAASIDLLWREYKQTHIDGFEYSSFCQNYRRWAGKLNVSMRQHHAPADKLFVDYAGATLEVINGSTGEVRHAQLFVAVLGASNYTFAQATWTQSIADWVSSHVQALNFFGGSPRCVVPDNLKSGVTRAIFFEPPGSCQTIRRTTGFELESDWVCSA